ncbi:hypothetical protein [Bacillus manliponensis]|uniref:hypothetical protein n=1 Tax=Bacillus manliponensis TaxID=574376 RepID=UPI0035151A20
MRNPLIIFCLSFLILITACDKDLWIIEPTKVHKLPRIKNYINELQTDKVDYKGYKVFDNPDGNQIIVISSGGNYELEIQHLHQSSKDTVIDVKVTNEKSKEKNSYVLVEVNKIIGAFYIIEDGDYDKEFEGTGYYD